MLGKWSDHRHTAPPEAACMCTEVRGRGSPNNPCCTGLRVENETWRTTDNAASRDGEGISKGRTNHRIFVLENEDGSQQLLLRYVEIPGEILWRAKMIFNGRLLKCILRQGHHLLDVIFRQVFWISDF